MGTGYMEMFTDVFLTHFSFEHLSLSSVNSEPEFSHMLKCFFHGFLLCTCNIRVHEHTTEERRNRRSIKRECSMFMISVKQPVKINIVTKSKVVNREENAWGSHSVSLNLIPICLFFFDC